MTPDAIEHVARKLYEQEMRRVSLLCVPWEQLGDEEREDLRYQVRSVLAVVEDASTPTASGLLGLPPTSGSPGPSRGDGDDEAETWPELWLRTGS